MLNKFLDYLLLEKRYSPHTITNYRKDLEDFSCFHFDKEGEDNIISAEKIHIRNFIFHCGENNLSKRTINRKLSSLRGFYLFLLKINEIERSPVESIKSMKMFGEKQIPYSEDEMQKMQNLYKTIDISLLDQLILEILYQTGLRKAELCSLLLENVNIDECQIKIIGKANKERIVPVSKELIFSMKNFIKERIPLAVDQDFFLINKKGKRINDKYVYRVVNKYLNLVTIKNKKNPHSLRHSFATHLIENGAEILQVKKLLGHQSLASTQVYVDANIVKLKKVFEKTHPRAKSE
ncbi:tyrosine-type recombinase/integrase [Frigoriflavimonas asaccharolytica]|uniref:Integrase/recombinase XerC n=1 Tax=Frigoriflavimonas asaccharolytica TaxID=2735899 RepID=A0A8J8K9T9_9FLAO|nr:tyrosine-type recombinase/integrase [Frigoriflavimonas asaccharolytica]NRS94021.1 integrase/recombinase XerC [Frigoriflavimonas asaccharolytica]